MSKRSFLRIVDDLETNYDYFKQKADAKGTLGFTGIIDLYGARYLRTPTWDDLQKIYEVHSVEHGLPGMIGSFDCMHWGWDNCLTAWRGQHTRGDQKGPTVILHAVASQDLWVWSAYFGVVRSCNDINVFEQSPLLDDWISDRAPKASFYANGNYYPHGLFVRRNLS
ncbi:uncharacterized protein LOC118481765 [Helianthus annuus]|uniref:uncharacterized protein LOC118481765 n=1 Tax=Helianthus annuus TaxID=4232 RepID=UPI00165340C6|nr:uncharacterized protein LOC118481765 [Helianthus annuus]